MTRGTKEMMQALCTLPACCLFGPANGTAVVRSAGFSRHSSVRSGSGKLGRACVRGMTRCRFGNSIRPVVLAGQLCWAHLHLEDLNNVALLLHRGQCVEHCDQAEQA